MRRAIARAQTWWLRLFVVAIAAQFVLPIPFPLDLIAMVIPLVLYLVRPPVSNRAHTAVAAPVRGTWVALNSPATAVPSHGVKAYGQMYAIDLIRPSAEEGTRPWTLRPRRPQSYSSFGEPVLAMASGTVTRVHQSQTDHGARDTWPLIIYMMTVEGFCRDLAGVPRILGNHIIVRHEDGTSAAYAHLRCNSAFVENGQRVQTGQRIASVGNTGNTSEPHLHVQLMDRDSPVVASGVPMTWPDICMDGAERDLRWVTGNPKPSAHSGLPPNGHIFHAN